MKYLKTKIRELKQEVFRTNQFVDSRIKLFSKNERLNEVPRQFRRLEFLFNRINQLLLVDGNLNRCY